MNIPERPPYTDSADLATRAAVRSEGVFQPAVPMMLGMAVAGLILAGATAWGFHVLGALDETGWPGYLAMGGIWLAGLALAGLTGRIAQPAIPGATFSLLNIWGGAAAAHFLGSYTTAALLPALAVAGVLLGLLATYRFAARRNVGRWPAGLAITAVGLTIISVVQLVAGFDWDLWAAAAFLTVLILVLAFFASGQLIAPAPGTRLYGTKRRALQGAISMHTYALAGLGWVFMFVVAQDNAFHRRRLEQQRDSINTMPPPPPTTGVI